jgi:serine protease Do
MVQMMEKNYWLKVTGLAAVAGLALVLAGCGSKAPTPLEAKSKAAEPALAQIQAPGPVPVVTNSAGLPDFSKLVESFGPAVVNVATVGRIPTSADDFPGLDPDDPMQEFFKRFGFGMPRSPHPPIRGEGSGFIVSSDGYIMTNAHVVDKATEVTVRLTDRREFTAKVVGIDERSDIAVLKVNAHDLPTVRLGDPQALKVGEWVVAIGSPFGFENSVTAGIVSAKSRSLPGDAYTPFIQTDVPVNPGNSGGPLFNMQGEVVGINSQIYSRTGGYQGVSFAIPIDVAVDVRDQLIKDGRVDRGRIGVTIQDVNQALADSFGLDRPEGALVSSVDKKGPAAEAGVEPGDVIIGVNGKHVAQSGALPPIIAEIKPGTEVTLNIWRNKAEKDLTVKVARLEEDQATKVSATGGKEGGKLGLAVRPLRPNEKDRADTDGSLVVEQVDGPAAIAGVQPGDIILAVNGRKIETVQALRDAVDASGKTVALLIQRGDAQLFLPVKVG